MNRSRIKAAILALVASTAISANAIDTNMLRRLDEIDSSIRGSEDVISEITDFFSQQLYTPINWFNIRQEPIVNEWAANGLKEDVTMHSSIISALREERDNILKAAGVAPGTCEIHGDTMEYRDVDISYGFPSPMPDGYFDARLFTFRNSDAPVSGGCIWSSDSPRTKYLLVCPTCARIMKEWLVQQLEETENESPNNRLQTIGAEAAPQPEP